MKRFILGLLISLLLLVSAGISAFAATPDNSLGYKDNDKINNVVAVEVLSSLGVISGYDDGNFYPAKPVTRAEMAKMICCLLNKAEESAEQGPSRFKDMETHWADPYVSWCSQEKIISGKNESTFDPNATVTGVEAAKMLLVALGYNPIIEGFTGVTWEANVLKAARSAGLLQINDSLKLHTPLTREEVAQIMLNALDANIVYYDFQFDHQQDDGLPFYSSFQAISSQRLYEQMYSGILQKNTTQDEEGHSLVTWTILTSE